MSMPTTICPRCKRELSMDFFQHPVRMCMVCYAMNPGNEGLDLVQLKDKASKSRFARALSKHSYREQMYAKIASQIVSGKIKVDMSFLDKSTTPCEECFKDTIDSKLDNISVGGEVKIVCPECKKALKALGGA